MSAVAGAATDVQPIVSSRCQTSFDIWTKLNQAMSDIDTNRLSYLRVQGRTVTNKEKKKHNPAKCKSAEQLVDDLEKIVVDALKKIEDKDGREGFRDKVLKAWMPDIGSEFLNAASERSAKVTDLIEDSKRYQPHLSEAAFESTYAQCLTAWYWSKKGHIDDNSSRLRKIIRSMIQLFVSGVGNTKASA